MRAALFHQSPTIYLMRDTFNATLSGVARRICEPGPSSLIVNDQNFPPTLSLQGGNIAHTGAASSFLNEDARSRLAGRVIVSRIVKDTSNGDVRISWGGGNTEQIRFEASNLRTSGDVVVSTGQTANTYDIAVVQRTAGSFMFYRVGTSGNYTLIWVHNASSIASPKATLTFSFATSSIKADRFRELNIGTPFDTDTGLATDRKASPSANDTITMNADSIVEFTFTAATGVTVDIMVRRVDDNNTWILRCNQGASTIALIKKDTGVETSITSQAQTWTNGTSYRVLLICDTQSIKSFVNNTALSAVTAQSFNQTATGAKVSVAGTELVSWPRTYDLDTLINAGTLLLDDQFTSEVPLQPMTQQIGARPILNDTLASLRLENGKLINSAAVVGVGDPRIVWGPFVRQSGRTFVVKNFRLTGVGIRYLVGWHTSTTPGSVITHGFGDFSGQQGVFVNNNTTQLLLPLFTLAVDVDLAIVLRSTGALLFYKLSTSKTWTTAWIDNAISTSPMYAALCTRISEFTFNAEEVAVLDLLSPFNQDLGIVTDIKAVSANNDTLVMNADGIIEHTITAATGVAQELLVRRVDDNNCWIIRIAAPGTNTIKLIEKVAGVETERSSVANTTVNATAYRIVVICDTQDIRTFVDNVFKNSYTTATFNQTATGVKVSHAGVNLISWPRTISLPIP